MLTATHNFFQLCSLPENTSPTTILCSTLKTTTSGHTQPHPTKLIAAIEHSMSCKQGLVHTQPSCMQAPAHILHMQPHHT